MVHIGPVQRMHHGALLDVDPLRWIFLLDDRTAFFHHFALFAKSSNQERRYLSVQLRTNRSRASSAKHRYNVNACCGRARVQSVSRVRRSADALAASTGSAPDALRAE